ncbi:hypothetical protein F5Y14DRAFT_422324 [Nemania sp. NC0429]|nr:hypothetical protein F5Y14DRAFT_422324 [Nemania sp. NC0429]
MLAELQTAIFAVHNIPSPWHSTPTYNQLLTSLLSQTIYPSSSPKLGNIIVSPDEHSVYHIAGIVDWEQAGWYSEYWEYFKLYYGVEIDHPWRAEGWADKVMIRR